MRKTARHGFGAGITSVVMLFAVLCLTLLAVLSLTTANQEWELANRSADAVTAYYAADSRASAVCDAVQTADVRDGDVVQDVTVSVSADGSELSYSVPIDEKQALQVRLARSGGGWRVAAWQAADAGTWSADQSLDVWSGSEEEIPK